MRHYSPFTDEKTEFQFYHLPKVSSRIRLHWCVSPAVLRPLSISAMADGDLGPITGAEVRGPSLSSFCPLEPQPAGGAFSGRGSTDVSRGMGMRDSEHLLRLTHPWTLPGGPGPPAPVPSSHFAPGLSPRPSSHSPMTWLHAPHWSAWEHLPLFGQASSRPGLHPQPGPHRLFSLTSSF